MKGTGPLLEVELLALVGEEPVDTGSSEGDVGPLEEELLPLALALPLEELLLVLKLIVLFHESSVII